MESQLENNLTVIDTLNGLIQINNDRIQGSEKAVETITDAKTKRLFELVIEQSAGFRQQLISEIRRVGGQAEWNDTTDKGKIHEFWLNIKSAFKSESVDSGIERVQFSEETARKAYDDALLSDVNFPTETRELLISQRREMKIFGEASLKT